MAFTCTKIAMKFVEIFTLQTRSPKDEDDHLLYYVRRACDN